MFLVLLLAVVGSVSYLGWRQSVPGVQAVATPPRFLGQKTAFTVAVEARRGNVAQVDVRVVQNGKSTSVVKQEGTRVGRLEVPVAVESAALGGADRERAERERAGRDIGAHGAGHTERDEAAPAGRDVARGGQHLDLRRREIGRASCRERV